MSYLSISAIAVLNQIRPTIYFNGIPNFHLKVEWGHLLVKDTF